MFNHSMLRATLIMNGIDRKELANALGINVSTLSKKMCGKNSWRLEELKIMTKILGKQRMFEIFLS